MNIYLPGNGNENIFYLDFRARKTLKELQKKLYLTNQRQMNLQFKQQKQIDELIAKCAKLERRCLQLDNDIEETKGTALYKIEKLSESVAPNQTL